MAGVRLVIEVDDANDRELRLLAEFLAKLAELRGRLVYEFRETSE